MPRKKIVVDAAQVERAAGLGLTVAEIALLIGCDKRTLERRFLSHINKGRLNINSALLRTQINRALGIQEIREQVLDAAGKVIRETVTQRAVTPSDRMLEWVGKQRLGQKEPWKPTRDDAPPGELTQSDEDTARAIRASLDAMDAKTIGAEPSADDVADPNGVATASSADAPAGIAGTITPARGVA